MKGKQKKLIKGNQKGNEKEMNGNK